MGFVFLQPLQPSLVQIFIIPGAISILLGSFPCRLRGKWKDGSDLSMRACIFKHNREPVDHQKHTCPFIVGKKQISPSSAQYPMTKVTSLSQDHFEQVQKPLDLAHNSEQFKELPMSIHVSPAWLMDLR